MKKISILFLLVIIYNAYSCETLLHMAVLRKDIQNARSYLNSNVDINSVICGKTPLAIAIENEDIAMMQLLLEYNPVDKCFSTAFRRENQRILHCYFTHHCITKADLIYGYQEAEKFINSINSFTCPSFHTNSAQLFINCYIELERRACYTIINSAGGKSTLLRDVYRSWARN